MSVQSVDRVIQAYARLSIKDQLDFDSRHKVVCAIRNDIIRSVRTMTPAQVKEWEAQLKKISQ